MVVGSNERANSVHCHQYVWASVPEELTNRYKWIGQVWEISQHVQHVANNTKFARFFVWSYKSGNERASGATDAANHCRCQKKA